MSDEKNQVDQRVQAVVNAMAVNVASMKQRGATGNLHFEVKFDQGNIPDGGLQVHVDELVNLTPKQKQETTE
jgi:hypothetical protein